MLTFGFDRIILLIFLQITVLPQRISEEYELAYLAKNKDDNGNEIRILQETDKFLSISWIPFLPSIIKDYSFFFKIVRDDELNTNPKSVQISFSSLTCERSEYNITGYAHHGYGFFDFSIPVRYSRVPRIKNIQLQSEDIRNVIWKQQSTFCSADDATVIFSGQDDRPLEMIIVQGDEKKYSLRNKAENRLIFTISHGNRFSLPKLEVMTSEAVGEETSSST
ncbi:unnamed protein product, partial [Trichobilharzia szidati]